jgi:ergothioneine biosynthesis protein EgtB
MTPSQASPENPRIESSGSTGFAFDCEGPRHTELLHPHALADRTVTNGEWAAFIADGGYRDPRHWLSDGWAWVQAEGIEAPLYWQQQGEALDTLRARRPPPDRSRRTGHPCQLLRSRCLCQLGRRAPADRVRMGSRGERRTIRTAGNQLDAAGAVEPRPSAGGPAFFGDVWEWTGSAYRPYPGFRTAEGAVGEYNGKFMSGQFVLRGGSCATPRGHVRASYRNFFYPHQRWQFTGVRLAKDL